MTTYDEMIDSMPVGLDRAVLRVLSYRRGADKAIKKRLLIRELAKVGQSNVNERHLRQTISDLRKLGHLIGSSAGKDPGYYLLADWNELENFLKREIDPRIQDLSESRGALVHAASAEFGEKPVAYQERLF